MTLSTQLYRSLSATPLLLVALLALARGDGTPLPTAPPEALATGQLLLPLLAAPASCPVAGKPDEIVANASETHALVLRVQPIATQIVMARCRV